MQNSTDNYQGNYYSNITPSPRRKRSKWWIPLVIVVSVIGLFVISTIAFFGYIISSLDRTPVTVNDNSVLYFDLSSIPEYELDTPFSFFFNKTPKASFLEITNAIKAAKEDDRIKGIYFEFLSPTSISQAKANELQEALQDFKESGKFIYSYIEISDENGYFNALPSDSIFIGEESILLLNGFGISSIFPKGLFDKIGVEFEVVQCEDFKSAGEIYKNKKFSDSARYQEKVLLSQHEENFINAVEKFRKISKENILNYFNEGIISPNEIINKNLADVIMAQSDVRQFIKNKIEAKSTDKKAEKTEKVAKEDNKKCCPYKTDVASCDEDLISIDRYVQSLNQTQPSEKIIDKNKNIAIIYGNGPIVSERSYELTSGNSQMIVADEFVKYLKEAREDKSINAILLRINSPGGSVIASEAIYQEILKTKKVKPVYASMADVAASGGYYIAMACDTIIAHPRTITGSIGVIAAYQNMEKLAKKLDITVDTISTGNGNPFLLSPFLPLKKDDKNIMTKHVFDTYSRFLTKVAKARNKSYDEIRSVAKGRVWSGEDAYSKGLVDVLGGISDAIKLLKKRINVEENKKIKIYMYPNEYHSINNLVDFFSNMQTKKNSIENLIIESNMIPENMQNQLKYSIFLNQLAKTENTLVALPYYPEIK